MSSIDIKPQVGETVAGGAPEFEEHMDVQSDLDSQVIWALKIPRFLLERWGEVDQAGVELGTLVVDSSSV